MLEAQSDPGGQVVYAAKIPWRQNMIGITRWLYDRCMALGVTFRFNVFAERAEILALDPQVVILATGGMPELSQVEGGDDLGHATWDILSGEVAPGKNVLVYDETGGQSGPTAAEFLARAGSQVDLMTPDRMIAQDVGVTNHAIHLRNLYAANVVIKPDRRLTRLERDGNQIRATSQNEYSAGSATAHYDQVIIDAGTVPMDELFEDLASDAANQGVTDLAQLIQSAPQPGVDQADATRFSLFRIGDCVSARGIHAATLDANRLCQRI